MMRAAREFPRESDSRIGETVMTMQISLVNFSGISTKEVLAAVRVVNRQLAEDFEPYWHWSARVRLEGASRDPGRASREPGEASKLIQAPEDLRGDGIIYIWDSLKNSKDAESYHAENDVGLPYGFVFTELSKKLNEEWTVTLSHEVLELVGDPTSNTFAAGPHPEHPEEVVLYWYEMCDAVQEQSYEIDGLPVSDFILPTYFTEGEQRGARNNFLGTRGKKNALKSFGIANGGYAGYYDPLRKKDGYLEDERALKRRKIKGAIGRARRGRRYQDLGQRIAGTNDKAKAKLKLEE
jgi:hypothetical protein